MIEETVSNGCAARGACDTKSAVFDRKHTFSDRKMAFRDQERLVRWAWSARQRTLPFFQEPQMIRRRLLIAATVIASVVLAACSDMTAPKNDCPVTNGSSTC